MLIVLKIDALYCLLQLCPVSSHNSQHCSEGQASCSVVAEVCGGSCVWNDDEHLVYMVGRCDSRTFEISQA